MKHKFRLKEASKFGWPGIKGKAYSASADFKPASTAVIEVRGSHGKVKSLASNLVYYVLEGSGEFVITGRKIPVKKTDVIIVPKNTPYDYHASKGKVLRLFLVNAPSWVPNKEVKLA